MVTLTTRFRGQKITVNQHRPNGYGDIPVYETPEMRPGQGDCILAEVVWVEINKIADAHGVAKPVVVRPAHLLDV